VIDISLGDLKLAQLMWLLWLSAQNDIERIHVLGYMDFLQYFRENPSELKKFTQKIVLRAFQGSLWRDLVQWEIYHRKIAISWPCPYFFDTEVPRPEPEGLTKLK
jgi:hypothetical protein